MNEIDRLTELFKKFPGIGPRQARRFVYFLLRSNPRYINDLSEQIKTIKQHVRQCQVSYQYFYTDNPEANLSPIIQDPRRNKSQLMVVEKDLDLENLERTGVYKGWYFVLGGLVPIADGKENKYARIQQLQDHLEKYGQETDEIIFALSLNPEGEHTREYLAQLLKPKLESFTISTSTLGRGISTGADMEYIDEYTFENALKGRK